MKIINLTPHDVVVANPYLHVTFKASGSIARIEMQYEKSLIEYAVTNEVKLSFTCHNAPKAKVINVPELKEGVYYIVSSYVAQTVRRPDLLSPLTDNSAERDSNGVVVSVKGFQTYSAYQEFTFENRDLVTVLGAGV